MKKAFTMIELIFVIVIIGVLAAIAIPKLSATRDDAKISSTLANLKLLKFDCVSFYSARGENNWVSAKVSDITDVPLYSNSNCSLQAKSTTLVNNSYYICNGSNYLVKIDVSRTHLTISKNNSNNSLVAKGLYSSKGFKDLSNSIKIGGINVKR